MEHLQLLLENLMEGFTSTGINTSRVIVAVGLSVLLGAFVHFVYWLTSKDGFYSKSYNLVLGVIAPIMSALVLTMQSSLIISLSSIGALSIIRFRTPIKEPQDLLFLFWSIGGGIMCGAGAYEIALWTSFFVTIAMLFYSYLPARKTPYLLVINARSADTETAVDEILKDYAKSYKIRSRNMNSHSYDLVIEIRTDKEQELVSRFQNVDGITGVSLLSHDGNTVR